MPETTAPEPRRRRRWLLILGGVALGGVLVAGFLRIPAVQLWLLKRAVGMKEGWRVDFRTFSADPGGIESSGLAFAMPGIEASAEPVNIRLQPLALLSRRELQIEAVEVDRLRLTLTPARFAAGGPSAPFRGVLPLLRAPLAWSLEKGAVNGRVEVRDEQQALGTGYLRMSGGGLTARQSGRFSYELTADSVILRPSPAHRLHSAGTITLTPNETNGVGRIELDGDLRLPHYGAIALPAGRLTLSLEATERGERYRAVLTAGAASVEFNADFDAEKNELAGTVRVRADDTVLVGLLGDARPALGLDGEISFKAHLATHELMASLAADLTGGDWQKLVPELASADRAVARLQAALSRRAGKLQIDHASLDLRGATTPLTARLELTEPVPLPRPPATPVARLTFERWPVIWLNSWLKKRGLEVAGAEFAGAWSLALAENKRLTLASLRPATIGPLTLTGGGLPTLPELHLSFDPTLEFSPGAFDLRVPAIALSGATGDRLEGGFSLRRDHVEKRTQLAAEIRGPLPTLLTGPERPLPFSLAARAEAGLTAGAIDLQRAEFRLFTAPDAPPAVAVDLVQPMRVNTGQAKLAAASPDFLRLRWGGTPLDWLGRWLPTGWEIGGKVGAGESLLRQESDNAFTLHTPVPWEWNGARVRVGGREFFSGSAHLAPALKIDPATVELRLADFVAEDDRRNRLTGLFAVTAGRRDNALAAQLALAADLPELDHSAGAFGPLRATVELAARRFDGNLFAAERFEFSLRNADQELLSLAASEPFLVGFNAARAFAVGTVSPLRLRTGEIPVDWLQPWLPVHTVRGVFEPAEYHFTAELQKYRVRPVRPLRLRDLSIDSATAPLVRAADLAVAAGADVEFHLNLLPKFAVGYRATLRGEGGELAVGGHRAADLEFALDFIGNEKRVLPQTLDLTLRADLAVLHELPIADRHLPAAGNLVLRTSGDLLGRQPVTFQARLSGVPTADGKRVLDPLELNARGKIDSSADDAHVAFDIGVRFGDPARLSDLAFQAKVSPEHDSLEVASTIRGARLDFAEVMAWQSAFAAPARARPKPAATGRTASRLIARFLPGRAAAANADAPAPPFWHLVRGSLDLEIGAVEFAPYRIENVRGNLRLTDREFTLSRLEGRMFEGNWGGQVRVQHDPAAAGAAHTLDASFRIAQFDSARVVQTVFRRDTAVVEAKVDVEADFTSRGDRLPDLIASASGGFAARTRNGVVRFALPNSEMNSSLAVLGGAVTFSPELRALGRLLPKLAEMPVEDLRLAGRVDASGEVRLSEFALNSPQARFTGRGRVAATSDAIMSRPLDLSLNIAAKDEMAVILGGMKLLERQKDAAGFQAVREKLTVGGKAGEPDLRPLYDLLARSVSGSTGTWGYLMRKVQADVDKRRAKGRPVGNP